MALSHHTMTPILTANKETQSSNEDKQYTSEHA